MKKERFQCLFKTHGLLRSDPFSGTEKLRVTICHCSHHVVVSFDQSKRKQNEEKRVEVYCSPNRRGFFKISDGKRKERTSWSNSMKGELY